MQKFKLLFLAASCFLCIEGSIKQLATAAIFDKSDMDLVADLYLIDPIMRKCLELELIWPPSVSDRSIFFLAIHAATDSRQFHERT